MHRRRSGRRRRRVSMMTLSIELEVFGSLGAFDGVLTCIAMAVSFFQRYRCMCIYVLRKDRERLNGL
jgi:hypothetical protein